MERLLKSRYRIKDKMGEGPFSVTYAGTYLEKEDPLVIKIFKRSVLSSSLIKSVKKKVRSLCQITHLNIAKVIDGDYGWQGFYFVREYVRGTTLGEHLRACGRLGTDRAIRIADDILNAVAVCHAKGIIHGALCPNNVIVMDDGSCKVTDFVIVGQMRGSLKELAETAYSSSSFLSPEELKGEVSTPASDVHAAGLLICLLLTGKHPFEGGTKLETSLRIMREAPPSLSELRSDVPSYLEDIVSKALEKDPLMRFRSMNGLLESIRGKRVVEEARLGEGAADVPFDSAIDLVKEDATATTGETKGGGKRRRGFWFAAVAVLIAALFGLAYAVLSALYTR